MADDERKRKRLPAGALLTQSAKKRRKREQDLSRLKKRVYIGGAFDRWTRLMQAASIERHEEFALLLLDCYEASFKKQDLDSDMPTCNTRSPFASTPKVRGLARLEFSNISALESTESELSGMELMETSEQRPEPSHFSWSSPHPGPFHFSSRNKNDPLYVDPFELTIYTSEEGNNTCTGIDDMKDEDYEPSIDISLGPTNAERIGEMSLGDIFFGECEEEDNEKDEQTEDANELGIVKVIDSADANMVLDETFLVFKNCLMDLAESSCSKVCVHCENAVNINVQIIGSALHLRWVCTSGHLCKHWCSQPILNKRLHAGDLLIPFAVLASGNNFGKIALFARALKFHCTGSSTFHKVQRSYLVPTIDAFWKKYQVDLLRRYEGKDVILAGDGRMDSPGFSAQYCTYSLMEIDQQQIMSIVTVDKRETGKVSTVMEKLGFKKALVDLTSKDVDLKEVITDQHIQITSLIKKEYPCLKHSYDIWHVAKNLGKKINAAGQDKESRDLLHWTSHITNHFWHTCKEATNEAEFRGIWLGMLHHVVNEHSWILSCGGNITSCSHGPILEEEKKWLKKGGKAHEALRKIALDKKFLRNIPYFLNFRNTAHLESFNQLVLMYAAKRYAYSPPVYKARCQLAALDNNFHADREVQLNKDGTSRMHRVYNKKSKRWTVHSVKERKNYNHLYQLALQVVKARLEDKRGMSGPAVLSADDPRHISKTIAAIDPPSTAELAEEKKSRL